MPFRPKFDQIYRGPWDFEPHCGVGIMMAGAPADRDKSEFIETLMRFGCNPVAAQRILADLDESGTRCVTLVSALDFNGLGEMLKDLGVVISVIPPSEAARRRTFDNSLMDAAALRLIVGEMPDRSEFTAAQIADIEVRAAEFAEGRRRIPHSLGFMQCAVDEARRRQDGLVLEAQPSPQ